MFYLHWHVPLWEAFCNPLSGVPAKMHKKNVWKCSRLKMWPKIWHLHWCTFCVQFHHPCPRLHLSLFLYHPIKAKKYLEGILKQFSREIHTAPYISWSLSYIHISTRSLFRISAIWCAPYLAVRNFSRFFSSEAPEPPKFTCLFGVPGVADEQVGVALPLRPLRVETSILELLEVEPTEEVDEVDPCKKLYQMK